MTAQGGRATFERAREDFRHARRQAAMEKVLGKLTGRPSTLLPFDEVRAALHGDDTRSLGLREVPLDAIVGSVGRYRDFSRRFLPRRDSGGERWARILTLAEQGQMPPVDLYKIGDAYFVLDGNHRVSIARQRKAETITAYVTEVITRVPLSVTAGVDEVIRMAEYADFLEATQLDVQRPHARLLFTLPGRYPRLRHQIESHRYALEKEQGAPVPLPDAAADWYDTIYRPVARLIREHDLLREFPHRTEADLFLWIEHHREELSRELGWTIPLSGAVDDLAERTAIQHSEGVVKRLGRWLHHMLMPEQLQSGPQPGSWRVKKQAREEEALFERILVAVNGEPGGWPALELAMIFAEQEQGQLLGLHVESSTERLGSYQSQVAQSEFLRRSRVARVRAEFVVDVGEVAPTICRRARWADLIVAPLEASPSNDGTTIRRGFRTLVRRCGRPLLAVPPTATTPTRALLAYDGSPKADEALFIAAYLAERWDMPLHVVTVPTAHTPASREDDARDYLSRFEIEVSFALCEPPIAEALLAERASHEADLIIMGGYGYGAVREAMLGSAVNGVLQATPCATMICR